MNSTCTQYEQQQQQPPVQQRDAGVWSRRAIGALCFCARTCTMQWKKTI